MVTTKLLAVDDSKTIRKVLDITFGGDDFQTTIHGSTAEALQAIREDRPQVALLDAALGADSGYELCRQIKAEAPDIRVLILSSKHRPYDEAQGTSVGADGYFDKPFDSQKLIEKVNSLVSSSAAATQARAPLQAAVPAPAAPPIAPPLSTTPRPGLVSSPAQPAATAPSRPAAAAQLAAAPRPVTAPLGSSPISPSPSPLGSPPISRPAAKPAQPPAVSPLVASAAGTSALEPSAPGPKTTTAQPSTATDRISSRATSSPAFTDKLKELGLSTAQLEGVLALSREVVEQVVWEVVPTLAETLIKEEIARLTAE